MTSSLFRKTLCTMARGAWKLSQELCNRSGRYIGDLKNPCCVGNDFERASKSVKNPPIRVTLIEGHGPGPAVCASVRKILKAADVPVVWDWQTVRVHRDPLTDRLTVNQEVLMSAAETHVVLRGPTMSTVEDGLQTSTTLTLNKALRANVGVQVFESVDGHHPFGRVRIASVRDNVSAEYSEIEHVVTPGVVQSIKTVTCRQSAAVARFAFDYATANDYHRVTALHKANVMHMSDGLFLKACRAVQAEYPDVEYNEEKLDKFCLRVMDDPCRYHLLLTPSLYGAVAGAACSALAGGAATVPSVAFGSDVTVFGTMYDGTIMYRNGIVHEPVINPTGLIRSATWMLGYLGMPVKRQLIETALNETIQQGVKTRDMGGIASCGEYTDTIIHNMTLRLK